MAIGDLRGWPDGAWASVSGYVSVPPGLFSPRTIHIQDATGGVTVYLGRDNWPPLAVGQPIRLQPGYLRHRSGDPQLYVRNGWHVRTGAADAPVTVAPWNVVTGQIGEANEGALVWVTGRVTRVESQAFWLDDGSGATRVFFAAGTGLARPSPPTGCSRASPLTWLRLWRGRPCPTRPKIRWQSPIRPSQRRPRNNKRFYNARASMAPASFEPSQPSTRPPAVASNVASATCTQVTSYFAITGRRWNQM